jgi:hypothetical protein
MTSDPRGLDKYPWVGPALFGVVAVAIAIAFIWFLF